MIRAYLTFRTLVSPKHIKGKVMVDKKQHFILQIQLPPTLELDFTFIFFAQSNVIQNEKEENKTLPQYTTLYEDFCDTYSFYGVWCSYYYLYARKKNITFLITLSIYILRSLINSSRYTHLIFSRKKKSILHDDFYVTNKNFHPTYLLFLL